MPAVSQAYGHTDTVEPPLEDGVFTTLNDIFFYFPKNQSTKIDLSSVNARKGDVNNYQMSILTCAQIVYTFV